MSWTGDRSIDPDELFSARSDDDNEFEEYGDEYDEEDDLEFEEELEDEDEEWAEELEAYGYDEDTEVPARRRRHVDWE